MYVTPVQTVVQHPQQPVIHRMTVTRQIYHVLLSMVLVRQHAIMQEQIIRTVPLVRLIRVILGIL